MKPYLLWSFACVIAFLLTDGGIAGGQQNLDGGLITVGILLLN
jgi:hypothetical protein